MTIFNERRLSLRDAVARAAVRRSVWRVIADRYGTIPLILAFICVSIGLVTLAVALIVFMAEVTI